MTYKPIKELGQNFLIESGVAHNMVDALGLEKGDLVVEIGAGLGALTKVLLGKATKVGAEVRAVEIDERFVGELRKKFGNQKGLKIIKADILRWLSSFGPEKKFKVIGSLPYYITSPILHSIIRHKGDLQICVLLMQKEVAEKVSQQAPKASYLSTYLQTFYNIKIVKKVPRSFFEPQPRVDGAVVRMIRKKSVPVSKREIRKYEEFLHRGYSKPRKMLNKVFTKKTLTSLKIDDKLRPQHIGLRKWLGLYRSIPPESQQFR